MNSRFGSVLVVAIVLALVPCATAFGQGFEGRVFFPTPETVALWEFNGFTDLLDGTPLPDGTIVPDLSGNALDATVEANGTDLSIAPGDLNFTDQNRELHRGGNANGGARLGVNDDQDLFEMPPEQDFTLELYINREVLDDPTKWGILAGTWHSRTTDDDAKDPNTQGAWYGYGLIRADESQTGAAWSFVLNPLQGGVGGTPNIGCCTENHAFFNIDIGRHYAVLVVNRTDDTAITYLDGVEINRRTLADDWSFTTPTGYEHARFTMFAGEDDPSRGSYRASPSSTHLDAVRVQRRALLPEEVEEIWINIQNGLPSPEPPNVINAFVTASATNALTGQCVRLSGVTSNPGLGQTITKWEWKVDDGAFEEGGETREVSFDAPKPEGYEVTLKITNSALATSEAKVKIKVNKPPLVSRIVASLGGQVLPGSDIYIPVNSVLTLDGTASSFTIPAGTLRCPLIDNLPVEPPAITEYPWNLDRNLTTVEDTRPVFDTVPFATAGDFAISLQVKAADGTKAPRTTITVHVVDALGNARIFHNTPETVLHYEFNELPEVVDGTAIPTGSIIEDLSGNDLDGTVEANDAGDLSMGPGLSSLDVPAGSNREARRPIVSNFGARVAVNNDQDAFEMLPEDDFSIELFVNREGVNEPIKWGILAGTWKSRNMADDAAGDANALGAWYGYGLIRSDETVVGNAWSWVLSPLENGPDSPPRTGCCFENHAFFAIPPGRHYVALSMDRIAGEAVTYVDGKRAAAQPLQPTWSFTTPIGFEHATFTLFAGEDDPSRNAYRPAPAGTHIDAVRVQRHALSADEAADNWANIEAGRGANPEFAPKFPLAPTGLVATTGPGGVSLDWNDNAEVDLQGYNLFRSQAGGPFVPLNAVIVAASQYQDTGLTDGVEYCYRVAAVSSAGQGPVSATICATPGGGGKTFRRGDANVDMAIDLTDPVTVLNFQFLAGPRPGCMDAADSDDSGTLDLTDAVYSLNYQFLAGPAPPNPGPDACGTDTTDDVGGDLGCDQGCP